MDKKQEQDVRNIYSDDKWNHPIWMSTYWKNGSNITVFSKGPVYLSLKATGTVTFFNKELLGV